MLLLRDTRDIIDETFKKKKLKKFCFFRFPASFQHASSRSYICGIKKNCLNTTTHTLSIYIYIHSRLYVYRVLHIETHSDYYIHIGRLSIHLSVSVGVGIYDTI